MADSIPQNDSTGNVNLKKKGKKRRISKHIVDAKQKSTELSSSPSGGTFASTDPEIPMILAPSASVTTSSKKQKLTKQKHTKDPVDVEGYLMAWKQQQHHDQLSDDGSKRVTAAWKFNKNTQSWLIRHLFDSTKISKNVFAIALQYFLKSNVNVQQRLRDDAMKRAVQYQQDQQEKGTTNQGNEEKDRDDNDTPQNEDEESPELILEKNRRKEYKRARKILDTLVVVVDHAPATTGK